MYLDESGNHDLTAIDPLYPVFVLGGVITDMAYAENEMTDLVRRFKLEMFGREDVILHTADIVRKKNGFERLKDSAIEQSFYDGLNVLMRALDYKVVACVIKKAEHLERYGRAANDPYLFALDVLVERFCFDIGHQANGGLIVAEKRRPDLDRALDQAWMNLKAHGTDYLKGETVSYRVTDLVSRAKKDNIAGLQVADLVVSPIGRSVMGKDAHEDWLIIEEKFRHEAGNYRGYGLVVLPR